MPLETELLSLGRKIPKDSVGKCDARTIGNTIVSMTLVLVCVPHLQEIVTSFSFLSKQTNDPFGN